MMQRSALRLSRSLQTRLPNRTPSAAILAPAWRQPAALSTRPVARWYSDAASAQQEAKNKEGEKLQDEEALKTKSNEPASSDAASSPANAGEIQKLKGELEAKNKEVLAWKDSYLRQVADYRNLQDRTTRDKQQTLDFALSRFARDLLPSIDNLGHALAAVPTERLTPDSPTAHVDLKNLHEGVKLMETVLMDVLKKHGLTKVDPMGEKFDPKVHDAVFQAPAEGKEDGTVMHVQQAGYILNGRVLRAPQVGVVKNS